MSTVAHLAHQNRPMRLWHVPTLPSSHRRIFTRTWTQSHTIQADEEIKAEAEARAQAEAAAAAKAKAGGKKKKKKGKKSKKAAAGVKDEL